MSYRISLVEEQHGYTIRFEKTVFKSDESKGHIENSETISTLAIVPDERIAVEILGTLNNFINSCINEKIIDKDVFRYLPLTKR